jgi:tetratricopeptide (TPR) repeat protein
MALGWHHHNAGRWEAARAWFEASLGWGGSAKAAEGLVYAYQRLDRHEDARKLAAAWVAKAPKLRSVLDEGGGRGGEVAEAYKAGDYARVLALTAPDRGPGAGAHQALRGWALLKLSRAAEASRAFEAALKAAAGNAGQEADAAQGLATALLAQGMASEARAVTERHRLPEAKSASLDKGLLAQEAIDSFNRGDFGHALRRIDELKRVAPNERPLAMLEAWSLLKLGRYSEARDAFEHLVRVLPSQEAQDGLRIATARATGRWD